MKSVILPGLLACLFNTSYAVIDCFWRPTSGTLWSTAANWNNGQVPDNGSPEATDVYKAYFLNNQEECVLDYDGPVINNLHLDQSKPLRIVEGGRLTVNDWAILSYSNPGGRVVIDGGMLECKSHLFVGPWAHNFADASGASVEQNGGSVIVRGVFGCGFDGGRGHYQLNGGTLIAHGSWELTHNGGAGTMDIAGGVFMKAGDASGQAAAFVSAGKLTAWQGRGKIVYDYNVTSPGMTTIRGIEPVTGDVDGDYDVDLDDVRRMADRWLDVNGGGANLDAFGKVDLRDFAVLAAHWMHGHVTHWHIAQTTYPTDDLIVTPHYADNFGIVGDGVTDVTEALQAALTSVSNLGGGALYLPAGRYKITGTVTVPSRVTLRGDWKRPDGQSAIEGTVLMAYAGRGSETGAPFIALGNCAGVKGISIWYPQQQAGAIVPYPPSLQRVDGSNQSVENVTLVNSYIGFSNYVAGAITASPFLRHIYGTPLKVGIEFDNLADVGRIESVHFAPGYWKNSGLAGAPTAGEHAQWLYENATGIVLGRIDWSYAAYVTVDGYGQGLLLHASRDDANNFPNGQCYGFNLLNCRTGVCIERSSYAGFMFTRFYIQNAETGIYIAPTTDYDATLFHSCTISASNYALYSESMKRVLMVSCAIQEGETRLTGGYLSVLNSDFGDAAGAHIRLNSGVRGASIQGNRFGRTPIILNYASSAEVYVDHSAVAAAALGAYAYCKPERAFKPAKADLFVVTDAPYHASADGSTDATGAIQQALDDAGANGGGLVFVPGGDYRLDGTLTVPSGVELRGVFDLGHSTSGRGSVLNTYHGKGQEDGTPFIQIQANGGIRGLTIHHAGQIYDPSDPVNFGMTAYPFMIRGLGSDVYVINIAATIPYQMLDLATYRCDRHYVDYVLGTALKTGIHVGGGSQDGQIQNCQFNPSSYAHQRFVYESIPDSGDIGGVYDVVWRMGRPYVFGHMTGQVLHQNFVFGGMYGVHLVGEGGAGPSGYCMGMGVDQCTTAVRVDAVGSGGLDMINSQIVTVDGVKGRYLETDASLTNMFRMFSTCCWGTNNRSVRANGGDVELQLFHIARDAEDFAWDIRNAACVRSLGGNVTNYVDRFLSIEPTAQAEFTGNIIRTSVSEMPVNTSNVTSRGNLRVP